MPNFIADAWFSACFHQGVPVRYPEMHRFGRATVRSICKYLCRLPHHENAPAPESNLLDDNIEHLWIDIGGEG